MFIIFRGEAVRLQDLREVLLEAGQAARSHEDSRRRAPHQVPRGELRVRLRRPERPQEAHEKAHRGEAVQVSLLNLTGAMCIYTDKVVISHCNWVLWFHNLRK